MQFQFFLFLLICNDLQKNKIHDLIRRLAKEELIGIEEHIYKDAKAFERWDINPFQIFEPVKQVLSNAKVIHKELHDTEYLPIRYLCEAELSDGFIYPCVVGIKEYNSRLIIVIFNNEVKNMKGDKNKDFEEIYEDPVVITDVLVLKHKNTGRNIYINHPDSIPKIERALKAVFGDAPKKFINYRKKLNISGSTLFIQLPDEIKDSYHLGSNSHAVITPIGQKKALVEFEVS